MPITVRTAIRATTKVTMLRSSDAMVSVRWRCRSCADPAAWRSTRPARLGSPDAPGVGLGERDVRRPGRWSAAAPSAATTAARRRRRPAAVGRGTTPSPLREVSS